MALTGYPQTYDHPKITMLKEGVGTSAVNTISGGNYMLIKAMGDIPTDWVEYDIKYPNSASPDTIYTIRATVGTVLHGPFSYVKHENEGATGGAAGSRLCYTLIYEVED
jgi:hypothetical protein